MRRHNEIQKYTYNKVKGNSIQCRTKCLNSVSRFCRSIPEHPVIENQIAIQSPWSVSSAQHTSGTEYKFSRNRRMSNATMDGFFLQSEGIPLCKLKRKHKSFTGISVFELPFNKILMVAWLPLRVMFMRQLECNQQNVLCWGPQLEFTKLHSEKRKMPFLYCECYSIFRYELL